MNLVRTGQAFTFNEANKQLADQAIARYPQGHQASAVMPLLNMAQEQNGGWLSQEAIEHVASYLNMPFIKVYEVATFYSMYHLQPVGKTRLYLCRTAPCCLAGAGKMREIIRHELGLAEGETAGDISYFEFECLGACANAPVLMVNDNYVEDLTEEGLRAVLRDIKQGKAVAAHSCKGRRSAAPVEPEEDVKKYAGE